MANYFKSRISDHDKILLDNFLEEEDMGPTEALHYLVSLVSCESFQDVRRFRKSLKKRVKRGIDSYYLEELKLLSSYIDHLIKLTR